MHEELGGQGTCSYLCSVRSVLKGVLKTDQVYKRAVRPRPRNWRGRPPHVIHHFLGLVLTAVRIATPPLPKGGRPPGNRRGDCFLAFPAGKQSLGGMGPRVHYARFAAWLSMRRSGRKYDVLHGVQTKTWSSLWGHPAVRIATPLPKGGRPPGNGKGGLLPRGSSPLVAFLFLFLFPAQELGSCMPF